MKALYRIVAALGVLLTIPALYFLKFIHIVMEIGSGENVFYFDDAFTIEQISSFFTNKELPDFKSIEITPKLAEVLMPLKAPAITTLVFACIFVLMVLAVFFCSALTNAKKVNIAFSLVGAIAVFGTIASFNSLTDMLITDEVSVGSIINAAMADSESALAGIAAVFGLGNLVGNIAKLVILQLDAAFIVCLLIFVFEIVWALCFVLIDLEPYKTPKVKPQHTKKAKKKKS